MRRRRPWGLRTSVTVAFTGGALILSVVLAAGTYFVARHYLVDQRERTATRQAFADASFVRDGLLTSGAQVSDVLGRRRAAGRLRHRGAPGRPVVLLVPAGGRAGDPGQRAAGRRERPGDAGLGHRPERPRGGGRRPAARGGRRVLRGQQPDRAQRHARHPAARAVRVRRADRDRRRAARPVRRPPGGGAAGRRRRRGRPHLHRRAEHPAAQHRRPRPGRHRRLVQRDGRGARRTDPAGRPVRRGHQPRAALAR